MITLANRLIARLPSDGNVFQSQWMWRRGINPIPAWTVNWLYDLQDRGTKTLGHPGGGGDEQTKAPRHN